MTEWPRHSRNICYFFSTPKFPAQPAPPPGREDPAIVEARERERLSALRRKGRASTILTGGSGVTGDVPLSRPQTLGS